MKAKKYFFVLLGTLLFGGIAYAQEEKAAPTDEVTVNAAADTSEEVITHKVMMGETIMMIAKKYKVKPMDIYQFNPDATQGIAAKQILNIPLHKALGKKQPKTATSGSFALKPQGTVVDTLFSKRESTAELKRN